MTTPVFPPSTTDETPAVPIGPLLTDIFRSLSEAGIRWAVLRNAEGLPDYTRNDVDILIHPADLNCARKIIRQCATGHGWQCLCQINKYNYCADCLMSRGNAVRFLPIDLWSGLSFQGFPFGDTQYGLAERRLFAPGMWTVSPGFEAAITLMKELLPHGDLKLESRQSVRDGATNDATVFTKALTPYVGARLAEEARLSCSRGDWQDIARLSCELRRRIRQLTLANLCQAVAFVVMNIRHHLVPPLSTFVVLLGPDGSGKTTIAEGLAQRLYKQPFKIVRYLKSNFGILPELKRLKALAGGDACTPAPAGTASQMPGSGMIEPNPLWRSLLYALYYASDLCVGRLKLRRFRGQWSLIIFDRYYFDYYYQLGNCKLPRWYVDLVGLLVPKPDLAIYLDRDADDIHAKKPELDVEEIRREQQLILRFLNGRKFGRVIDARRGVEQTLDQICNEITRLLLLRKRY